MKDIYTLAEIKDLVAPVAKRHNLSSVWVFGSYARGDAKTTSDIDFIIDDKDIDKTKFFEFASIYGDLKEQVNKDIDIITINSIEDERNTQDFPDFKERVYTERKVVYEQ